MIKKLLTILLGVILNFVPEMSDTIRKEIINFLKALEVKAKSTKNPIDDIIVAILLGIME